MGRSEEKRFWVRKRKGFGFGREDVCRYMKKKEGRKRKKRKRYFSLNAVYLVC